MIIAGTTRVVGVIGYPVRHSRSPAMHNAAFEALGLDCVYTAFEVAPAVLHEAVEGMKALGIVGLNVTIPHKPAVYWLMNKLAPSACAVEAVNTIHFTEGLLTGHNTDIEGFARPLESAGISLSGQKVTLLGAGGAARSVAAACLDRKVTGITILNRTLEKAQALAERLLSLANPSARPVSIQAGTLKDGEEAVRTADILVQCTNLGMHPHEEDPLPVPAEWLHSGMVVYDLIYNPIETRFLAAARAAGATTLNGVEMLVQQGAAAFEIWMGVTPPVDVMRAALLAAGQ